MRVSFRFSDVRLAGVALLTGQAIGGTGKLIEGVKRGAQSLGGFVRRCCFWVPALALSACATFEVTPFLREQITGDTWRACLAREYQAQARFQVRNGRRWNEATLLAWKGRQSLDDQDPAMEAFPSALTPRAHALAAAIMGRGRSCSCATAQARLDGWIVAVDQNPARDQAPFATAFDKALEACNAGN